MKTLRRIIEEILWNSRLLMVLGALLSLLLALSAFYMATVDVLLLPGYLQKYSNLALSEEAHGQLRAITLTDIIKSVDGYIITAILIIFALSLYELFLGKLEAAQDSPIAPRLIATGGLEAIKERIAQLLQLVLVIEFFHRALQFDVRGATDLLYMALGILAIGVTLAVGRLKFTRKD